jgi:hypothetical protein
MFVRNFVAKTCRDIIDDVGKLYAIQDGFIHFQLLRFCQATRLQYINSHIMLNNRCVLQQQHVDCKIADALLKKGTKQHADGWDVSSKDWTHMVLHLSHTEGGFGVSFSPRRSLHPIASARSGFTSSPSESSRVLEPHMIWWPQLRPICTDPT